MAGEARATLVATAELVVALSVAQRSNLVYGAEHELAQRGAAKVEAALAKALALEAPLALRFSPHNVYLGSRNLGVGHPILRSFADRFWRRGVAGLVLQHGATAEGLLALLEALNVAVRRRLSREESERVLREARPTGVELHFLREILSHEVRDEVTVLTPQEAQRQWDELMSRLVELTGPLRLSRGVTVDTRRGAQATDLATLVFEHLRQVQDEGTGALEAEAGRRVAELVGALDSQLREQIVGAAMKAPDLTPESLERFTALVGHDTLLDTLRRLNEAGKSISPAALRALSMLSLTQRRTDTPGSTGAGAPAAAADLFGDELEELLARMMRDEEADDYTTDELGHLLRKAETSAQTRATAPGGPRTELPLGAEEGDRQFLLVARELLRGAPADGELAAAVCREGQRVYLRLLDRGAARGPDEAMRLARDAGGPGGRPADEPWVWETPEVLDRLRERLTESGRWEAEATVDQLVAIGPAAVPLLVEVLATSDSLAVRRRALAALESMAESPAPQLVPLLDASQPWYLQRNAVSLLRRHRDASGATAAVALWPTALPRLRREILDYLLTIGDPRGAPLLAEVLAGGDAAEALAVARAALKTASRDTIVTVIRRAEDVPADLVGGDFHMALLRALSASRHPQALHYVAELPARRQPVLPWQRMRFRREIAAMVER